MKLIKASFLIKEQEENLEGVYKQIEWAGRHCYKSEDKITPDSAKEFVERMIKSNHVAMLEHGTIYLDFKTSYCWDHYKTINGKYGCQYVTDELVANELIVNKFINNKYSVVNTLSSEYISLPNNYGRWQEHSYVTTNYRVLIENGWLDDLQYICEPTEFHEKRTTVRFICDRGVTHEFVRHRVFSFAQESTRYCNYSKDKFGNELTFIKPCFKSSSDSEGDVYNHNLALQEFEFALIDAEKRYLRVLDLGWSPQQARSILPNALKSELVVTGFDSDWEGFFKLRDDSHAHPQAFELAHPLHEEFIKLNKCN